MILEEVLKKKKKTSKKKRMIQEIDFKWEMILLLYVNVYIAKDSKS